MAYVISKLAEGFYNIEQDFVRCFLIIGDNSALLIDTGFGGEDLKKQVEEITKLPITVLFTHADGDHIGNAAQFERRLMHPSEFDHYMGKHSNTVSMEPIWEGEEINLGTYNFEVILIPGHTPGSIALLEKEKRFLIGGDSVQTGNIYMFGAGRNFEAYRASLKKLQGRMKEFDIVYTSHDKIIVNTSLINILYDAAGNIMKNKIAGKPENLNGMEVKLYETDGVAFYAL